MSEETKHHDSNAEMQFEHQDMRPGSVYAFLIGLAVAGIVIYFVLWGFYNLMEAYENRHQPRQNPLVQPATGETRTVSPEEVTKFPQPRLEKNERLEINDFLLQQEQTLNSYGWVDQKAGVVRIPVERAMQLIAQRGLPTIPRVGTVPPAEGSTQQSETSNPASKKQ